LEDTHLAGVGHNVPFLAAVMEQERFRSGALSTSYIKDEFPEGFHGLPPEGFGRDVMIAAGAAMNEILAEQAGDPSDRFEWAVLVGAERQGVMLGYDEDENLVIDLDGERALILSDIDWRPGLAQFRAVLDGRSFTAEVKRAPDGFDIRWRASRARVRVLPPHIANLYDRLPEKAAADTSKLIQSPMPGLVVSINVKPGQAVKS